MFLRIPKYIRESREKIFNLMPTKEKQKRKLLIGQTGKCCWHCTYTFNTFACIIPQQYKNKEYVGFGNFCSYNCALAYLMNEVNIFKKNEYVVLLYKMFIEEYGPEKTIKKAPPRIILEKYNENGISIEEFRESFYKVNIDYHITIPKSNPISIERKIILDGKCFESTML